MPQTEPQSRFFTSQRLKLHYVDWGNAAAPPLIFVHGGRDHSRSWDWVAREFIKDYHVIAVDLRGHGDSAHINDGAYSIISMVADLNALVDHLDCGPVNIVAHSLGGNIATRFAGLFPEKLSRLVAVEGIGQFHKLVEKRDNSSAHELWLEWFESNDKLKQRKPKPYKTLAEAEERMARSPVTLTTEQVKHLTLHGTRQNPDGTYNWKFDNYTHQWLPIDISGKDMIDFWNRITCPTLLCYGTQSFFNLDDEFDRHRHFTGCDLTVKKYEGSGHWIHHDAFDEFVEDVRAFLN